VWFALAKIPFMGARAADLPIGDSVAIIGAGPVGQMALRWMHALRCNYVVAVVTIASRLEHARRGGATATVNDASITAYLFGLTTTGRFPLDGLAGAARSPIDCQAVSSGALRHRAETMGITYDWSTELEPVALGASAQIAPGRAAPSTAR
jgi:threonine dehydrogenase-like Zn-dependent dehydrogenase